MLGGAPRLRRSAYLAVHLPHCSIAHVGLKFLQLVDQTSGAMRAPDSKILPWRRWSGRFATSPANTCLAAEPQGLQLATGRRLPAWVWHVARRPLWLLCQARGKTVHPHISVRDAVQAYYREDQDKTYLHIYLAMVLVPHPGALTNAEKIRRRHDSNSCSREPLRESSQMQRGSISWCR